MPLLHSTLAQVSAPIAAIIAFVALAVGVAAGFALVRFLSGQTIAKARREAEEIISRAQAEAQTASERAALEAEKAILERKEKFEAETEATRNELRETERRLTKREDLLDKKLESFTAKEEALTKATEALRARETKLAAREEVGFPPAVRMACVEGPPAAVASLVEHVEQQLGDAVEALGPVEIEPDPKADPRTAPEEPEERVLLRVKRTDGKALATALHTAQAARTARKATDVVRVQLDPPAIG